MEELGEGDNECFSLIDGAAPDEFLVSMTEPNYAEGKVNILDGADVLEKPESKLLSKKGKYNLRKSLAWDSAFFTSSGVLDAEELSSIIEGSNNGKQQTQHLPGIQEDVTKSTDSFSTLGSDNLTLDSLEADLFCDIRASIQRSGKSSNSRVSDSSGGPEETSSGSQSGSGRKSIEVHHGNAVKLESVSKKPNTSLKGDKKLMKLGPVSNQVKKPVASRRETPSSLSKLPATTIRGISMAAAAAKVPAAKRMSVSTGRNNVASAMGCRTSVPKGPLPGDSRSIIPKTASSVSASSTITRTKTPSTRSSYDSAASASSSSETSRILPLNGLQGKIDRTTNIPSAGIKGKIPSKVLVKGKIQAGTSRISSSSSTPQISPSVSPASSISEWSSSSSVATVNQVSNASKDCSDPHGRVSLESYTSNERDSEVVVVPNISAHKLLGGNGSAANPVSSKPSGLRMPSPKIGFFDGAKAVGRNPKAAGDMQSRSGLPRNRMLNSATTGGSSPSGSSSKARIGHVAGKDATVAAGNFSSDNERINRERNSPSAKLLDGRKHLSESGLSSRKRSGLKKNASPKAISQLEVDKISSAAKADHHMPEICDDPKVLNTHQMHEMANGVEVDNELHLVSVSQEVGTADHQRAVAVSGGSRATGEEHDEVINGDKGETELHQACASPEVGDALRAGNQNEVALAVSGDCGGSRATSEKQDAVISGDQANTESQQDACMSQEASESLRADHQNAFGVALSADCGGIEVTCEKHDSTAALIADQQNGESVGKTENELSVEKIGNFEPDNNAKMISDCHVPALSCPVELHLASMPQEVSHVDHQNEAALSGQSKATGEKHDEAINGDKLNTELHQTCVSQELCDTSTADHQDAVAAVVSENNEGDVAAIEKQSGVICQDEVNTEHQQAFVSEEAGDALKADHENAVAVVVSGDCEATSEKLDGVITELHRACMSQEVGETSRADDEHVGGDLEATSEKQDDVTNGDQVITELHQAGMSQEVGDTPRADDEHVGGDLEATSEKQDDVINGDQLITEIHQACVSQEVGGASRADEEHVGGSEKQDDVINVDQVITELPLACVSQEVGDTSRADDEHEATSEGQDDVINVVQVITELPQACVSQEVGDTSQADDEYEATSEKQHDVINVDQVITELHRACVSQEVGNTSRADNENEATSERQDDVINVVQVITELPQACVSREAGDTSRADDEYEATSEKQHDVINVDQVITELHQACVSQEVGDTSRADDENEATSEKQDDVINVVQVITELPQACVSQEVGNTSRADDEYEATSERQDDMINGEQVITELHQACVSQEVGDTSRADDEHVCGDREATSERRGDVINGGQVITELHRACVSQELSDASRADIHHVSNELINGDQVNTEIHQSCASQEVGYILKTDHQNVAAVVLSGESGGSSTTSEKHGLPSVMPTDQQNVETEGNNKELSEGLNGNFKSQIDANLVCDTPMELPGLNQKREEAEEKEKPKQTELSVPSRKAESIGSDSKKRKPFADKNSLSDEFDIEVLVKSFTSLSLGNVQTQNC